MTTLSSLELCGGSIGDLGCAHLATLPSLTSLNLSQNESITNCGAAALSTLTNLRALNLSNTGVNSDALKFFGGLLKLQSLALYGCRDINDSPKLSSLHSDLPSLRCLRLNSPKNVDGVIHHSEAANDDDSYDDEADDDDVVDDVDDYEEDESDDEEGVIIIEGEEEDEEVEDEDVGEDTGFIEAVDDDFMINVAYYPLNNEGAESAGSSEEGNEDFQDAFNEILSVDSSLSPSRNMDYDV
jgi:hypothetical protein